MEDMQQLIISMNVFKQVIANLSDDTKNVMMDVYFTLLKNERKYLRQSRHRRRELRCTK